MTEEARSDSAEIHRLEGRLRVLAETTRDFAEATVDYGRLVDTIVHKLSDVVMDSCVLFVEAEEGKQLSHVSCHAESESFVHRLQQLLAAAPIRLDERSVTESVFRTGVSVMVPKLDFDELGPASSPVYVEFLRNSGAHSMLIMALRVQGQSLGVLSFLRYRSSSPPFDERDRALAQTLADHAALAMSNNRLLTLHQQAEARFARLSDAGMLGVIVADLTGRITEINDVLLRMIGYTREEVLAGTPPWVSLTAPGFEPIDMLAREQLVGVGVADLREKEYVRKDGSHVPVMIGSAMLEGSDQSLISFVLDLTDRKRAEAATLNEQARFRALVENSADGIALSAQDGSFVYLSPAAARILGRPVERLLGTSFRDYVHPDDLEIAVEQRRRLLETDHAAPTVRRMVRPDGTVRWVEVTASNRLADPAIGAIVGNIRDITDRKQAEEALVVAEQRFIALFESGIIGIVIIDTSGRISDANDTFLAMLGFSREDLLAGRLDWNQLTPPEWLQWNAQTSEELRRTGRSDPREKEYLRKDGTRVPVLVGKASVDGAFAISVSVDLTDRKRAEAVSREEHVRFRALIENSADGITLNTFEGTFDYVSPAAARILGRPGEDLVGHHIIDYVHPDDRAAAREVMRSVREAPSNVETTTNRVLWRDGSCRWIEITRTNRLDDPAVAGVVCNLRDITDRKLAEEALAGAENARSNLEGQLRQAQKMEAVGRLAGGIAHDFNNVLSVILSYASLLMGDLAEGDPTRADLGEIQKAGNRAADLTRQLLMFSRQQVIEPKVIDLNELLVDIDKMLQRILGEDIDLVSLTAKPVSGVLVDPSGMEQVVMNLVVNARDAMPTGGRLTIETENVILDDEYVREHMNVKPGPYVMLAVTDTGTGMDKATQTRIFEPFFTTKGVGKGTGLGLSTVFGIVMQSGGSVWVYSEPGRGTTFKIYLPCVGAEPRSTEPALGPAARHGTETILLVEDEDQVRSVARGILRRSGYHVIEARNASEALLAADKYVGTIHLVLSDVVMPQMSGAELASRLAALRPEMKVLCMSGYTDDSVVRHGVLVADLAFLQKPFTPESLTRKVREVLDAHLADITSPSLRSEP